MKLLLHLAGLVLMLVSSVSLYEWLQFWWDGYESDEYTAAAFLGFSLGLILYWV